MLRRPRCVLIFLEMVSPRHYTVDPMLSASGNLFCLNAMKRFCFTFLPVVLVFFSYIVNPEYFVCRGVGMASSSFF